MLLFITVLITYLVTNFLIPMSIRGRGRNATEERGKDAVNAYYFMLDNELVILIIGLIIGFLLIKISAGLQNKPTIVSLETENETFTIKTRQTKVNTLNEHTGNFKDLRIVKAKTKIQTFGPSNICYKFYRNEDYLGMFIPEHFVWADIPKIQIINVLKHLKPIIKDRL